MGAKMTLREGIHIYRKDIKKTVGKKYHSDFAGIWYEQRKILYVRIHVNCFSWHNVLRQKAKYV